jgi:hypothetical protein
MTPSAQPNLVLPLTLGLGIVGWTGIAPSCLPRDKTRSPNRRPSKEPGPPAAPGSSSEVSLPRVRRQVAVLDDQTKESENGE